MKHLGISGGGTKIAGLYGAAESIFLDKNYQPDIISGISAGALLSVPLAMRKFDQIKSIVLSFGLKQIFSKSPITKNGGLKLWNTVSSIVLGRYFLGKQKNVETTLSSIITKADFEAYKKNDNYPVCIVGAVDFYTGGRVFVNLKEVSYDLFLKFVNASASIPIYSGGIKLNQPFYDFEGTLIKDKVLLYDGGVRDHSPTHRVIGSNAFDITESCTIFSRPYDNEILNPDDFSPKNIFSILSRYIEITNTEVSKNDELLEVYLIQDKNIKDHGTIFLPRVMQGVFDVNNTRLRKLYMAGKDSVKKGWK